MEVSASCDSIRMLLFEREMEIYRLSSEYFGLEERLKEKDIETVYEPTGLQWFQIWGFRFLLAGITLKFTFKKIDLWKRLLSLFSKLFR